jgi:hypothetical protein
LEWTTPSQKGGLELLPYPRRSRVPTLPAQVDHCQEASASRAFLCRVAIAKSQARGGSTRSINCHELLPPVDMAFVGRNRLCSLRWELEEEHGQLARLYGHMTRWQHCAKRHAGMWGLPLSSPHDAT